jgi:phage shock protein E
MQKVFKFSLALVALIFAASALAGCSQASVDVNHATAIIDVRTPDEFSGGHLKGAVNIDVEGANFNTEVSKLDLTGNYLVYCHSGRRAGIAIDTMKSLGFSGTLTNAGGIADATTSTGLPVVTN